MTSSVQVLTCRGDAKVRLPDSPMLEPLWALEQAFFEWIQE